MSIFKRKSEPTGRRRLSQSDEPDRLGKKFTYRSKRSEADLNLGRDVQREPVKVKKKQRVPYWLRKSGLIILLIALVASTVNILTLSTKPKVQPLDDSKAGLFLRDNAEYEAAAQKLLSSSMRNQNKITVDTDAISQKLVRQYPELDSVSMTIPLLANRPIIYIQPAEPILILSARNGAFVVASNGKALLRANKAEDLQKYKLPLLTDQSGLEIAPGGQALTSANVHFIRTVITELASRQYTVSSMALPAATSELDVQVAGQPYTIKFNLQSNRARQQAGTFISTIDYLKKQNTPPSKYVDVRVDGKAYYQ